jgi:hypothetical protein
VQSIVDAPSGYEVDPNKLGEGEDLAANMTRLVDAAGRALEAVTDSLPDGTALLIVCCCCCCCCCCYSSRGGVQCRRQCGRSSSS